MNKFERSFDRVCTRLQLNPGNWLPHIKPDGIYEMGTQYESGADFLNDTGTEVPIECFSIYGAFWTICYNRRKKSGREPSKWERLWGFLSEVDMGIYDTTNWVPIDKAPDCPVR